MIFLDFTWVNLTKLQRIRGSSAELDFPAYSSYTQTQFEIQFFIFKFRKTLQELEKLLKVFLCELNLMQNSCNFQFAKTIGALWKIYIFCNFPNKLFEKKCQELVGKSEEFTSFSSFCAETINMNWIQIFPDAIFILSLIHQNNESQIAIIRVAY